MGGNIRIELMDFVAGWKGYEVVVEGRSNCGVCNKGRLLLLAGWCYRKGRGGGKAEVMEELW